jgi:Bacteriophage minor capsid protein
MSAFVDTIATWLTTNGLAGGSTGWVVQKYAAAETPDQMIVIYQTGGPPPEQATNRRWAMPTFQLMARSKVQATAEAKAQAIFDSLDRADLNGLAFFNVQQSTPSALGPDVNGRHRFALNFRGGAS